jgi:hypothetical protein
MTGNRIFRNGKLNLANPYATIEHESIVNSTTGMTRAKVFMKKLLKFTLPVVPALHPCT